MEAYFKAGILGGVVLFVWSIISWMVLPWHMTAFHKFKDEVAVTQIIQSNVAASGIYYMPLQNTANNTTQSPVVFAAVHLEPVSKSMTTPMIIGLITQIIAATFVAFLLTRTTGLSYMGRVGFVVAIAFIASLMIHVPYWNWLKFESSYTLIQVTDLLISWFLAGLVMAKFVIGYGRTSLR